MGILIYQHRNEIPMMYWGEGVGYVKPRDRAFYYCFTELRVNQWVKEDTFY